MNIRHFHNAVRRLLERYAHVGGGPVVDVVHVAGPVAKGEQVCARCGCVMTSRGQRHYEAGALVRRMEFADGSASVQVRDCVVGDLCRERKKV